MDAELQKLFPHEAVREIQQDLIQDIHSCFRNRSILLAHAPTGLGKTASALTVALHHAQKENKKVFFLTNRHTQHRIAIDTLKLMKAKTGQEYPCVDLIGKRWMCNQEVAGLFGNEFNEFCKAVVEKGECEFYNRVHQKKELTVEAKKTLGDLEKAGPLHNEELVSHCKAERLCSYEMSLALAKKAKIVIGDYYYLFNHYVQTTILNKLNVEIEDLIVIVDEAHNLPSRITEMLSTNLTTFMVKNGILEAKKFNYQGVIFWLQELQRILNLLAEFGSGEREKKVAKEEFMQEVKNVVDYDEFINQLELAADEIRKKQRKSYLGGIATFLQAWNGSDEGYTRIISQYNGKYGENTTLSYICLDPAVITSNIFQRVHTGVLMSGTLKPAFMYKDVLGITRGIEKEYSSPFPLENRRTIIIPETSTKYTVRGDAMFQKIAEKCSELAELIPGNIAFFFPSYDLRDKVGYFMRSRKKICWEKSDLSKEEKEKFLEEFKREKEQGALLLGVSGANFAEGVDLPGDLLNGVVVVGLPLAKPDLKTKEVIAYYEKKFGKGWDYGYIYPAINKCLQSAGRCIRSETDKGAIIYLDERFAWENYFICFPKEGLMVTKEYRKVLDGFF